MKQKPQVMVALGFVSAIWYTDGKDEWQLTFNKQKSWGKSNKRATYVMLAKNTQEIILVRWKPTKTAIPKGADKQKRLVHTWSHWPLMGAWKIPTARTRFRKAGRITRIEYSSDKFEHEPDKRGKFHFYFHDFKKSVPLYMNSKEDAFKFKHPRLLSGRGIIA